MYVDFRRRDGIKWIIGMCVMERKAKSPSLLKILKYLEEKGIFEIIIFPEIEILNKEPREWPLCHYFISYYSVGFPIDKAIEYVKIRRPFHLNDLSMQVVMQDRRTLLSLLEANNIPTARRLVTQRAGPPVIGNEVKVLLKRLNVTLPEFSNEYVDAKMIDEDTLRVGKETIKKPFVEKPVSADDHNLYVYYPKSEGGGVRKLYRKVCYSRLATLVSIQLTLKIIDILQIERLLQRHNVPQVRQGLYIRRIYKKQRYDRPQILCDRTQVRAR